MSKKICVFNNTAPLYREKIFTMIDGAFECDWYFRPTTTDIKEMDVSKLKRVKYLKICGNPFKIYWKFGFIQLLFKKEYDIYLTSLEVHCITDWIFVWVKSHFFKNKKVYAWTHGYNGKESYVKKKLKKWLFSNVTGAFTYGQYAKNLMIKDGISENKLFVIHNSLDYDNQLTIRKELHHTEIYKDHFGNSNPNLFFIGRLTKVKRLDMALQAIAILRNKGKYYNMTFIGDGEVKGYLEEFSSKLKIEKQVWFYGACYDEKKLGELIYNADLCVAPGNIGLTAMHTLVFGTPALTHNDFKYQMPEFEAICDGKTGTFYQNDNVESLADAINKWFNQNKNRREELRSNCFKEIDTKWNPHYQLEVLKSVFNNLGFV